MNYKCHYVLFRDFEELEYSRPYCCGFLRLDALEREREREAINGNK